MSSECEENEGSTIETELELAWSVFLKVSQNEQLGMDHRPLFEIVNIETKGKINQMKLIPY